jgi:hypothetical protein
MDLNLAHAKCSEDCHAGLSKPLASFILAEASQLLQDRLDLLRNAGTDRLMGFRAEVDAIDTVRSR